MKTILVVDDMPMFRDPIAACLEAKGYRTLRASNGQEALAMLWPKPPDLILLDLGMPVMDGLTFLENMVADPLTRDLPVMLLTASEDPDQLSRAAKLGTRDYMQKSRFSLKNLLQRVASRLGECTSMGAA